MQRITVLIGIFLDGTTTTCMYIVPTESIDKEVPKKLDFGINGIIRHQKNGYITKELFEEFITKILIPENLRRKTTFSNLGNMKPVLILDVCTSHQSESLEFFSVIFIPPHSSHIFQACDALLFSLIKNVYNTQLQQMLIHVKKDQKKDVSTNSCNIIAVVTAVQSTTTNYQYITKSFGRVGLTVQYSEYNQPVACFNPKTDHITNYVKNLDLLQNSSVILENSRKRIAVEDI